jgi:hypothetical protein
VPLEPKFSSKKLGKRKAQEHSSQRPSKKIKNINGKGSVKAAKSAVARKRQAVVSESDSEDGSGWEGLEDDFEIQKT